MLSFDDAPTIRHAIIKRLDKEPGVRFTTVYAKRFADGIGVGIEATIADVTPMLQTRSAFRLPPEFELRALHNEIDQVAEQIKAIRRAHLGIVRSDQTTSGQLAGTGIDGTLEKAG
jgi:hypothetical protein